MVSGTGARSTSALVQEALVLGLLGTAMAAA